MADGRQKCLSLWCLSTPFPCLQSSLHSHHTNKIPHSIKPTIHSAFQAKPKVSGITECFLSRPYHSRGSHLRRSEGTAVGHIWVGWLSLTYPFLFPALLHFYSIKGAFIIYKRRPFEIGLVFSLLDYTEGVQLDIGKSY